MLSAEFTEKIPSDKHDKHKNTNKTQINAKLINSGTYWVTIFIYIYRYYQGHFKVTNFEKNLYNFNIKK